MENQRSGGSGFVGLLLIAFIVLKLTHVINWSWWWVLAPAWISAAVGALAMIAAILWVTHEKKRQKSAHEILDSYAKALNRRNRV